LSSDVTEERIVDSMNRAARQTNPKEKIAILNQVIAAAPLTFAAYEELAPLLKNLKERKSLLAQAALNAWKVGDCRRASRFETQIDTYIRPSSISAEEWASPQLLLDNLPPYPQAMQDFLEGPDPFDAAKKARETHFVVPLLKNFTIDGVEKPRTLENLDALDKATGGIGCRFIWDRILDPANDKPAEVEFQWAVMTKNVVPGSRHQSYSVQKDLVEKKGYEVPGFLDAATCILWEHRHSGNRLFTADSELSTYTRCKENIDSLKLLVGGFAPDGLYVCDYHLGLFGLVIVGVAGLRKF